MSSKSPRRTGRWVVLTLVVICALVLLNWVIKRAGGGGSGGQVVLLEVHPNERGPGGRLLTGTPVQAPGRPASADPYLWKAYQFYGSGSLRIQVCAQAFASFQNKTLLGFGNGDTLRMKIDGVTPKDLWKTQSGPAGGAQWNGDVDQGKRVTLEFVVTGLKPGKHTLEFSATLCPIIYWVKVSDLEHR